MINKKAFSPLTMLYVDFVFFIVWAMFAAEFINYWAQKAIVDYSYVGLIAFFLSNLNLFVYIFLITANIAVFYYSE